MNKTFRKIKLYSISILAHALLAVPACGVTIALAYWNQNRVLIDPKIGFVLPFLTKAEDFTRPFAIPKGRYIPDKLKPYIVQIANKNKLPPELLAAVAYQESRFNPLICSDAGACGVMQFMPGTAKQYKVNVKNALSSLDGGAKHLVYLHTIFKGNRGLALAAYNWGEGNVLNWRKHGSRADKMPKETRDYVLLITGVPIEVWVGKVNGIAALSKALAKDDHTAKMRKDLGFVATAKL